MKFEAQTFVFEQPLNEATGYSLVLVEGGLEIEEVEGSEGVDREEDGIAEGGVSACAKVISLDEAEKIWEDVVGSIYLVENPLPAEADPTEVLRDYEPLEQFTGLFRIFFETPPTPTGILGFARRFGFLTDREETDLSFGQLYVPELYGERVPVHAESLRDWLEQILRMNEAVSLWQLAKTGDVKGLSKYLRWSGGVLGYWSDYKGLAPEFSLIQDLQRPITQALNFRDGDVIAPAIFIAATIANMGLEGRVSPQLEMTLEDMKPRLAIRPVNLLGALWLQLARAIDGDKEYRACQQCDTWFEIGIGAFSRAKRFCSNRCRVAFSRARKKAEEDRQ